MDELKNRKEGPTVPNTRKERTMSNEVLVHGITCKKQQHVGTGHLHSVDHDGPYQVVGLHYCGRCHIYLDKTDFLIIALVASHKELVEALTLIRESLGDNPFLWKIASEALIHAEKLLKK